MTTKLDKFRSTIAPAIYAAIESGEHTAALNAISANRSKAEMEIIREVINGAIADKAWKNILNCAENDSRYSREDLRDMCSTDRQRFNLEAYFYNKDMPKVMASIREVSIAALSYVDVSIDDVNNCFIIEFSNMRAVVLMPSSHGSRFYPRTNLESYTHLDQHEISYMVDVVKMCQTISQFIMQDCRKVLDELEALYLKMSKQILQAQTKKYDKVIQAQTISLDKIK